MAQLPLSSSAQPTDIYGGDEVSALVLDPGYCNTRAGFAGEDVPKCVLPSFYAHVGGRNLFGDEVILPREGLEVRNYMNRDSVVEDWDVAPRLWEHMLVKRLQPDRVHLLSNVGNSISKTATTAAEAAAPTAEAKKNGEEGGGGGAANGKSPAAAAAADGEGDVSMTDAAGATSAEGAAAASAAAAEAAEAEAEEQELKETALGENPLLLTEAAWNTPKAREKSIEIAMEQWGVPAFWLAKTPVLAAFAAGKATALVIDVGGANASVVAVHDGMVLKRSIQRSPAAGIWLSSQIRAMWESPGGGAQAVKNVVPTFMVENKTPVDAGADAQVKLRGFPFDIAPSLRAYEEERLLTEFKESVVEVWRGPGRFSAPGTEDYVRSQPGRVFEMPDGSNQMWREQRYRVAEGMWDETAAYASNFMPAPAAAAAPSAAGAPVPGGPDGAGASAAAADAAASSAAAAAAAAAAPAPQRLVKNQTIPELIRASLNGVDVDLRPTLLMNVVVTGSTSLLNGFNDRLNNELTAMFPSSRVKIHAAGLTTERRFGSWIGGSILASLGTFHQMWISRKEYEENGAGVVEKRCK